jgi:putative ABC transport system substrate-binding protein
MRRRDFIGLLAGGAVAWPFMARTQSTGRMRRIAMLLGLENDHEGQVRVTAFQQRLRELGWIEGKNVEIDVRWASGDTNRIRAHAEELVRLTPDVIVASSTPVAATLRTMTQSIPIVFAVVTDPVGNGLVTNLARPEGNLTGFTNSEVSMGGKWLEILKEIAPRIATFGVMFDPSNSPNMRSHYRPSMEAAARAFEAKLIDAPVHDPDAIERVVASLARQPDTGLIVLPDNTTVRYRDLITALAAKYRLPAIYPYRYFSKSGGLASYGVDTVDLFGQAATYVDRVLRGSKPADMPVQPPSRFEFVINLKTAKALGLEMPPTLLARADEVFE